MDLKSGKTPLRRPRFILECASQAYPGRHYFARWRRFRFLIRTVLCYKTTISWLDACLTSRLPGLTCQAPQCFERTHRPFLHNAFRPNEIVRVSLEHQRYAYELLPSIACEIAKSGRAVIARFRLGDESWQIVLEVLEQFKREGDWTLSIKNSDGSSVVSCSFSIAALGGRILRPRILIGNVQGPGKGQDGLCLFRSLTRKWHGWRPKWLAVRLIQVIAVEINARSVLMVTNDTHVYASWRYPSFKHRIAADYKALAIECGATQQWRGCLLLAKARAGGKGRCDDLALSRRDRRTKLLTHLTQQIQCSIRST
ncbi:DUF535 family protein [Caballeronia sp. LZ034LL]|uniref:DUF535 family protein n=1 Tax=Caballeronia sp. LZ034LL TaxID=3038567 RepID=UPI0038573B4C